MYVPGASGKKVDMIEPHFESRAAFRVLGIQDVAANFLDLWDNRFMLQHDIVQPQSTDKAYYAVWFETGEDLSQGMHLAGMTVGEDVTIPDGWIVREIPAATYAVFDSTLGNVGDTTYQALHDWLPNSEYSWDRSKPRFDLMPPDTNAQDSPTWVWIPIISR